MVTRNKVIVFDLDDTLYKEIDYLKSAYHEIADWFRDHYDVYAHYTSTSKDAAQKKYDEAVKSGAFN